MPGPLAAQRQTQILERLRLDGAVRVSGLAGTLGVSPMTIRRDIDELASRGLCRKVHGGATRALNAAEEPGFEAKSHTHTPVKQALAQAAADLVEPGQAVAISAGTTTFWLAQRLAQRAGPEGLTVVTNSLPAAETLAGGGAAGQTLLTGGTCTPSQALVGPLAEQAIGAMRFDWLFLGVHGMDPDAGFTTPNLAEAATDRAFVAAAAKVAVLADASKWGLTALARIAPISAADRIFTDPSIPAAAAKKLRRVTELTIVKTK
jgi:DeoR/GlpR family transcriptional regulator of sugar metabolism